MVRWELEHGATAERERERLEKSGREIPEHLFAPDVRQGYDIWLAAFWELSSDRQIGHGVVGQVPASSIRDWSRDMTPEEAKAFRICVRAMDDVFLAHVNKSPDEAQPKRVLTPEALMGMGKK